MTAMPAPAPRPPLKPFSRRWLGPALISGALILFTSALILTGALIADFSTQSSNVLYDVIDAAHLLAQLERELLRLTARVTVVDEQFNAEAIALQAQLVQSRFNVLFAPAYFDAFNEAAQGQIHEAHDIWQQVQPVLRAYQQSPDGATQERVLVELNTIGSTTNRLRLEGNIIVSDNLRAVQRANQQMVYGLISVIVLFIPLALGGIVLVVRLRRSQRETDAHLQRALAAEIASREASALKDQFLATMSHELRTPMHAIIGLLGLMRLDPQLDTRQAEQIDKIRRSADRLLVLINDLLDIARIESGGVQIVESDIAVFSLVERWRQQVAVLAEEKRLNFNVHVSPGLPPGIHTDEETLTRIAVNLLSNAIKFTDSGAVSLSVDPDPDPGWYRLIVQDTGRGIAPADQVRIFAPFVQGSDAGRWTQQGSGLGLAIARQLAEAMGGTIHLTSQVGVGSIFTVRLPLKRVSDDAGKLFS